MPPSPLAADSVSAVAPGPCVSESSSFEIAGAFLREFETATTQRRHHHHQHRHGGFRLMGCLQQHQHDEEDSFEAAMRNIFVRMQEAMKSVEEERDALRSKCEDLQTQVMDLNAKLKHKRSEGKRLSKTCHMQEENLRKSSVLLGIITHHADELEQQVSKLSKTQLAKKKLEQRVRILTKDRDELTSILIKALEKKKEVEEHAKKRKKQMQDDVLALTAKVVLLESELEDRKSYIALIESELDKYMQQVVTITNDEETYEDDDDDDDDDDEDDDDEADDEYSGHPKYNARHRKHLQHRHRHHHKDDDDDHYKRRTTPTTHEPDDDDDDDEEELIHFDFADVTPATSAESDPQPPFVMNAKHILKGVFDVDDEHEFLDALDIDEAPTGHNVRDVTRTPTTATTAGTTVAATTATAATTTTTTTTSAKQHYNFAVSGVMELILPTLKSPAANRDAADTTRKAATTITTTEPAATTATTTKHSNHSRNLAMIGQDLSDIDDSNNSNPFSNLEIIGHDLSDIDDSTLDTTEMILPTSIIREVHIKKHRHASTTTLDTTETMNTEQRLQRHGDKKGVATVVTP